ncbi:MAG: hypothetical protein OXC96_04520 [Cyanobacteria bacterium MAG CAR1_bin_15]|nr:hypothetical protein [Cyanobacteria bacterium MAG CAR1_bin_15]
MALPSPGALPNQPGILPLPTPCRGSAAAGGMDALLRPVALEGLDGHGSNGRRFEAQPAYGFPAANDQLTMTPAVALASVVTSSQALQWGEVPQSGIV